MAQAKRNPYAEHQPTGGSGSYLKFESGKTIKVRILSDPAIFDNNYEGRLSTKYAWIVYNFNDEEVQIMQLPKTGYRALATIGADEDYGNPLENDYDLKITRTGERQQTKYNVVPSPAKAEVPEEAREEAGDIELVERLNDSPNSENAAWLFDEIDGNRPKTVVKNEKDTASDDDDEPVNLDDIWSS